MYGVRRRSSSKDSHLRLCLSLVAPFHCPNSTSDINDPSSIATLMGNFLEIKNIRHPHLLAYVNCSLYGRDSVFLFHEDYPTSLRSVLKANGGSITSVETLKRLLVEIITPLIYLQSRYNISHRNISLDTIKITEEGMYLLSDWAIYHISNQNSLVQFPIGNPLCLPPEVVLFYQSTNNIANEKADVWSIGILLLQLYFGEDFYSIENPCLDSIFEVIHFWYTDHLNPSPHKHEKYKTIAQILNQTTLMNEDLKNFISQCLQIDHNKRPNIEDLLDYPFLLGMEIPKSWTPFPQTLCDFISQTPGDPLANLSLEQIFHIWRLKVGSNIFRDLQIDTSSPSLAIDRIPLLMRSDDDLEITLDLAMPTRTLLIGEPITGVCRFDDLREALLNKKTGEGRKLGRMASFSKAFSNVVSPIKESFGNLFDETNVNSTSWKALHPWNAETVAAENELNSQCEKSFENRLQINSNNKDFRYQYMRIKKFQTLIDKFPISKDELREEARVDIPPVLRGKIWACLLGITGNPAHFYENINIVSETPSDHQLDLDIPRCHQYNEALSTPLGRKMLKRVLKAWILTEPSHVYWQGLDSVAATWVSLNVNDESLAFYSFKAFLNTYTKDFFVSDNSILIKEYMHTFFQLIFFHDPHLGVVMNELGIKPSLYAVPWFLTLFSHVFPLDKVYTLWDGFLVGPEYPHLFIGFAILYSIRDLILHQDFNETMMMFSDLPSIVDIDLILYFGFKFARVTPPSLLHFLKVEANKVDIERFEISMAVSFDRRISEFSPRISLNDYKIIRKSSLVIDIRSLKKFETKHILGSISLSFASLQQNMMAIKVLSHRNSYIVVLCDDDFNPGEVANKLVEAKLTRVCILQTPINQGLDEDSVCTCIPFLGESLVTCLEKYK